MEFNWPIENEGFDKPMLSERDRIIVMMERLTIFSKVQTAPRGGEERSRQRLRKLYDEVAGLPTAGRSQRIPHKLHREITTSKELDTGLVSVTLLHRPEHLDTRYNYQPKDDGSIDYSVLVNPYDDSKSIVRSAEEVGLYQAEMALDLVLQVRRVECFSARLHPVSRQLAQQ